MLPWRLFAREDLLFYVPSHALAEALEVVCRKVREHTATEQQLAMALPRLPSSFISVAIERRLEPTVRLSLERAMSFHDALYVVLAGDRETMQVTDDRKLKRRLEGQSSRGMSSYWKTLFRCSDCGSLAITD